MSFIDPAGDQGGQEGEVINKAFQTGEKVSLAWSVMQGAITAVIVVPAVIYFIAHGLPVYIGLGIILVVVGGAVLSIVVKKRQLAALSGSGSSPKYAPPSALPAIRPAPDEKIVAAIGGILRTGKGLRDVQVLGAGAIRHPENAMVVTDKNIFLLYIPLPGADVATGDVDMGQIDWFAASGEITAKLNAALASAPLDSTVGSDPRNYGLSLADLANVKFTDWERKISFVMKDGREYSYGIREKNDYENLKSIFNQPSSAS